MDFNGDKTFQSISSLDIDNANRILFICIYTQLLRDKPLFQDWPARPLFIYTIYVIFLDYHIFFSIFQTKKSKPYARTHQAPSGLTVIILTSQTNNGT